MKEKFKHRQNSGGSFDSICLRCFRTVSSQNFEEELAHAELSHECDESDEPRGPVNGGRRSVLDFPKQKKDESRLP